MVQWMQTFPRAVERPLEFGIITAIAVCAVTIPVSYLSVIYIEDPAIRLGRKLTRDRSDSPGRSPSTGSTGRTSVSAAATASRSFSMGDGS
jgi:peptidoglycan/LPS O-acetylase OafA/YrhL